MVSQWTSIYHHFIEADKHVMVLLLFKTRSMFLSPEFDTKHVMIQSPVVISRAVVRIVCFTTADFGLNKLIEVFRKPQVYRCGNFENTKVKERFRFPVEGIQQNSHARSGSQIIPPGIPFHLSRVTSSRR